VYSYEPKPVKGNILSLLFFFAHSFPSFSYGRRLLGLEEENVKVIFLLLVNGIMRGTNGPHSIHARRRDSLLGLLAAAGPIRRDAISFSIMEPPEKGFCGVTRDHVYWERYYNDPVSTPGGSGFIVSSCLRVFVVDNMNPRSSAVPIRRELRTVNRELIYRRMVSQFMPIERK